MTDGGAHGIIGNLAKYRRKDAANAYGQAQGYTGSQPFMGRQQILSRYYNGTVTEPDGNSYRDHEKDSRHRRRGT